jgi:hypothetical protein
MLEQGAEMKITVEFNVTLSDKDLPRFRGSLVQAIRMKDIQALNWLDSVIGGMTIPSGQPKKPKRGAARPGVLPNPFTSEV